ncbi:MAG: hypothetical protein QXH18_03770, partial [Candidatus Micrarchaeia archaeon]
MSCDPKINACGIPNLSRWLSAILIMLIFVQNIFAQTPISSCQTITASGSYILTQDIFASDTCLRIGADNVVIDCGGHKIIGPGTESNTKGIAGGWGVPG